MTNPDHLIRAALSRIAHDTPDLKPVVEGLLRTGRQLSLDKRFHTWLRSNSPLTTSQARVLRAVFGDASLYRTPLVGELGRPLAARIVSYLQGLPDQPLLTGELPDFRMLSSITRLFGVQELPYGPWLDATVFPLLWAHAAGTSLPALPGPLGPTVTRDVLRAWAPLLQARLLDAERAEQLLRAPLSPVTLRYYFDTAHDELNVRNLMVFLGAVFDGDREGGRIQNRIPLQFARRFGLAARSVVDALAMMDVLVLVHDGIIKIPKTDPMLLRGLFDTPVPGGREGFWAPAMAPWRYRQVLLRREQLATEADGMFDTSLRYNLARATGLIEGRRARLAHFAPYYGTFSATRFVASHRGAWAKLSRQLASRVDALLQDRSLATPAIRVRDLANILVRDRFLPAADNGLPSVARYALGLPEPVPSGRLTTGTPRPARGVAPPWRLGAAEFARFVQSLDARRKARP